jgi:hypothetical protein
MWAYLNLHMIRDTQRRRKNIGHNKYSQKKISNYHNLRADLEWQSTSRRDMREACRYTRVWQMPKLMQFLSSSLLIYVRHTSTYRLLLLIAHRVLNKNREWYLFYVVCRFQNIFVLKKRVQFPVYDELLSLDLINYFPKNKAKIKSALSLPLF